MQVIVREMRNCYNPSAAIYWALYQSHYNPVFKHRGLLSHGKISLYHQTLILSVAAQFRPEPLVPLVQDSPAASPCC